MAPYLIPQAMQFAVPGTMLLAITERLRPDVVVQRNRGREGDRHFADGTVWPTLILATFVSFVAVVINDVAVSWGAMGVRRVFLTSIEDVTYSQLSNRTRITWVKRILRFASGWTYA